MMHHTPSIEEWLDLELYLDERDEFHGHEVTLSDKGIICTCMGRIRLELVKINKTSWDNFNWNDYPKDLQVILRELANKVDNWHPPFEDFPNIIILRVEENSFDSAIAKMKQVLRLLDYGWILLEHQYAPCLWGEEEWDSENGFAQDEKEDIEEYCQEGYCLAKRLKNGETIPHNCNWDILLETNYYWANILARQGQLSIYCPWEKLNKNMWVNILKSSPQFADKCDWNKIKFDDLVEILQEQPQLIKLCNLKNITSTNWAYIIREQVELAEYCDFSIFQSYDWKILLNSNIKFANKCNWNDFNSEDYSFIFDDIDELKPANYKELFKYCDFSKFMGETWALVLLAHPELSKFCDKWHELDSYDWQKLLIKQPQFAQYCNWEKIDNDDAFEIISQQVQLAKYYDWTKFNSRQICILLYDHPNLAKFTKDLPKHNLKKITFKPCEDESYKDYALVQFFYNEKLLFCSEEKDNPNTYRDFLFCQNVEDLKKLSTLKKDIKEILRDATAIHTFELNYKVLDNANNIFISLWDGKSDNFKCGIRCFRPSLQDKYKAYIVDNQTIVYENGNPKFKHEGFDIWQS